METRVTYRTSADTVKRLQELSDKYGISQSALLTMLVNERWLLEHGQRSAPQDERLPDGDPQPPPNFPNYVGHKKRKRKRH